MWVSLFAIAIATSLLCCVAATMMQPAAARNLLPWEG
jgi:hypothetical protein